MLSVGWRLARANAPFCRDVAPAVGLLLQDVAGYRDPALRAALGANGDIAVQAVARNSPAERARLAPNDPLEAIAGQAVASLPAAKPGDYARLAGLHDRIDAALRDTGKVDLVRDGRILTLVGEPACITRFEMLSDGTRAAADGRRVVIGRKLVEILPEEELLAAALAHELAHNVLAPPRPARCRGPRLEQVKRTEREADRLSVWLLVNAGYEPEAALRFFARWGPMNDLGILSPPITIAGRRGSGGSPQRSPRCAPPWRAIRRHGELGAGFCRREVTRPLPSAAAQASARLPRASKTL